MKFDSYNPKITSPGTRKPEIYNRNFIEGSTDMLPANGHDRCNYVVRYGLANFQIQSIMELNGRLDFEKLKKAARLSVDVEPVLGRRFVEAEPPYWKRRDDIDNIKFCSYEETYNLDEAIRRFLECHLDMDNDPMVKIKLIRSGPYDTLGVKINHSCCDGSGAKEYIRLLSEIYTALDDEKEFFIPKPRVRDSKDHERLFEALGIKYPVSQLSPPPDTQSPMWKFPWKTNLQNGTHYVACRFPYGMLDTMSEYGKSQGATINDLLVTALYRAMFEISQPRYGIPMEIGLTVDLRRYLPDQKASAIRNLSGGININLPRKQNESFKGTLSRVIPLMNEIKSQHPGIKNAIAAENVEKISFGKFLARYRKKSKLSKAASFVALSSTDKCAPVLSNLGYLSNPIINFGKTVVADAYIIPPVIKIPGFLIAASTYNGIVTIAAGYYKSTVSRHFIERLLDKIRDELLEGCKPVQ